MLSTTDVVVTGVRSAVHDSDPAARGDTVVFVHGNPGPMDDFEPLVKEVSKFARAVAVDLPGFGRADRPRTFDFSVEGYARHLGGVLDQCNVGRAHLVMHDFGGGFGLSWGVQNPARFASATLINTGLLKGYRWHVFARIWQTPLLGELFQLITSEARIRHALREGNPKPLPEEFIERLVRYSDWGQRRAVLKLYRATRSPAQLVAEYAHKLIALRRPLCVVWGASDPFVPTSYAEQQRDYFGESEVHVLPGLGHWPMVDDAQAVIERCVPFLRRQLAQSEQGPHVAE